MYTFNSRVRYSEIGQNSELSATGIVNYLQDCSTFQSQDIGLGLEYLAEKRKAWWLSTWQIVIDRYPMLGDEIVIGTWPYDFKGIYGYRNFTIRDKQGNYLVRANSIWFFVDTESGRPVRAEEKDILRYGMGQEPKLEMDYAPRKIILPAEYEAAAPIPAGRHHIDTNNHVNNAQYVEIAREVIPADFRIAELRVEYKKAAVFGDLIYPRLSRIPEGYVIVLGDSQGLAYANVWLRERKKRVL